jgi:hypothetical protein
MVPAVGYTESFPPVATYTAVHTAIAIALYRQDEALEMIDV